MNGQTNPFHERKKNNCDRVSLRVPLDQVSHTSVKLQNNYSAVNAARSFLTLRILQSHVIFVSRYFDKKDSLSLWAEGVLLC